jgi:beta-mannosidase
MGVVRTIGRAGLPLQGIDELPLEGTWQLRESIGETWRWYVAAPPPEALNSVAPDSGAPGWSTVQVPGGVVDALARSGTVPDPRRGWGSRAVEWTGSRSWVLRRLVELDESWAEGDAVLEFDGIDPGGRVFWDGTELGRVDGLYRPLRLPLHISPGTHVLAVVIDRVPPGVPQVGRTDAVRRHAPRLGYGWDFCPPFPHQGIWRPVRLRHGARLASLEVASAATADLARGTVTVRVRAEAASGLEVTTRLDLGDGRQLVATGPVDAHGAVTLAIEVPHPPLWWPTGLGGQPLAELRVRIGNHEEVRRIGFRHLAWERTPGSPADALPYGLRVNGVPVPLTGVNWAPADAQFGEVTRERLAHLLDLARASGVRLLRVWGGGLVETPEFFEACDERGLLVWQEFSQSSSGIQSAPTEDSDVVAAFAADARLLVPARRHHPSLVLWGGGNELQGEQGPLDTDDSAVLRALVAVVRELDPERGWLPTSPSGPEFHHRIAGSARDPSAQHDVHGPWEYQGTEAQHTLAAAGAALAHTEFGVEGMANRRLFEHLVPRETREPAGRTNPLMRHLGEWWNNAAQVGQLFGEGMALDEVRRASQWLQASGLAIALEADRRRWPRTSMVLPWQLAESYPNAWGTALVGFDGEPKPALGVLARAFADERVTLVTDRTAWGGHSTVTASAWLWSRIGRSRGGRLELSVLDLTGRELAATSVALDAVENPGARAELTAPTPDGPFLWRARWLAADGATVDDETVLQAGDADLAGLRHLPRTALAAVATESGWRVRNTGPVAAVAWGPRDVRTPDDTRRIAALADPRPLLPREERHLPLVSGHPQDGDLVLDAWNADPVPLPPTVQPAASTPGG